MHLACSCYGVLQNEIEEIVIYSAHSYYGILQNVMGMKLNNWSVKLLLEHSAFYED